MKYSNGKTKRRYRVKMVSVALAVILALAILGGAVGVKVWYDRQLTAVSAQSVKIDVEVPSGYSTKQIASLLVQKQLIRNATAFEWYVRNNSSKIGSLQAGHYLLDPSYSVAQIVSLISSGKVRKDLFTILPAQRLDQIRASLIKAGYKTTDVDSALNADNYKSNPALASKPSSATLEGFLYPESFQTTDATTPKEIITQALNEMSNHLTSEITKKFSDQGLSVFQAITLASIVEQEVSNTSSQPDNRRMVAGVFLNRLRINMVLGSDVTYHYAADITGQEATPFIDSPYNTRKYPGLPPGPISNVSESSLDAVANPIKSDYLFFVAGDDGKTYFSKTAAEHEALAKEHCKILCSQY
jgi:UPF0755 protein